MLCLNSSTNCCITLDRLPLSLSLYRRNVTMTIMTSQYRRATTYNAPFCHRCSDPRNSLDINTMATATDYQVVLSSLYHLTVTTKSSNRDTMTNDNILSHMSQMSNICW